MRCEAARLVETSMATALVVVASAEAVMKPWERALQRNPLCAFIEAVVDGFSPIDKHICAFARRAQWMRQQAWWSRPWFDVRPDKNGEVWSRHDRHGWIVQWSDEVHGEIPWRTLHAE